jgi:hypothetical protein
MDQSICKIRFESHIICDGTTILKSKVILSSATLKYSAKHAQVKGYKYKLEDSVIIMTKWWRNEHQDIEHFTHFFNVWLLRSLLLWTNVWIVVQRHRRSFEKSTVFPAASSYYTKTIQMLQHRRWWQIFLIYFL